MKDEQVEKLRHESITNVLLVRGGWVAAHRIKITVAFPSTISAPTIWKLALHSERGLHLRDIYCEAETIAGISVERHREDQPQQEH